MRTNNLMTISENLLTRVDSPNQSVSHLIYTDNFTVEIGEPIEGTVLKN